MSCIRPVLGCGTLASADSTGRNHRPHELMLNVMLNSNGGSGHLQRVGAQQSRASLPPRSGAECEEQFGKEKTQYLLGRGRAPWLCWSRSHDAEAALPLQPRIVIAVVDFLPLKSRETLRAKD